MLRRGFSEQELLQTSMVTFYELYLFETFIEPQGPVMNDFYQARLAHTILCSNPNMTTEGRKKLNMKDFYMIKDKVFKSPEEIQKEKELEQQRRKKALESMFEPELLKKAQKAKARIKPTKG